MKDIAFVLSAACLLAWAAPAAPAQEAKGIAAYQEIVDLATDGSAKVTTNLTVANWDADGMDLPLNFSKPEGLAVEAKDIQVTAMTGKTGDVRVIKLQFNGKPPAEAKFRITFTARDFFNWKKAQSPRGICSFSYTFINATSTNIGRYAFQVSLPPAYNMNGVTSSTPRATGEEIEPPYDFATENHRLAVNLRSKLVAPGKNAAIAFLFQKDDRKPLPVIVIGIAIAAVALYLKRDVLSKTDFVREVTG